MGLEQNVFERVVRGWEALGERAEDLRVLHKPDFAIPVVVYDDGTIRGTVILEDFAANEDLLKAKLANLRDSIASLKTDV